MAKVTIPKRVAGVKIPKKVRKRAKKALKLAESPALRNAAVAALGAATSAKGVGAAAQAASDGSRGKGSAPIDLETLKQAIQVAALDGIRRFMEGFDEQMRKAAAAAGDAAKAAGDAAKAADDRPKRGNGRRPRARSFQADSA